MAWDFEVVGYENYDGDRFEGKPDDIGDTYGQLVHAFDFETGESEHFWAFVGGPFDSWSQWVDYIEALMDMYGLAPATA